MPLAYSIWLVPAEKHFLVLEKIIVRLAKENKSSVFIPHCTLVGGIKSSPKYLFNDFHKFCGSNTSVKANTLHLGCEQTLFKSFFIQLKWDVEILNFQKKISTLVNHRELYQFDPHLSLMYKLVSYEIQQKIKSTITMPDQIHFDRVMIVRGGSVVEKWNVIFNQQLMK
jgi:hypothetical protein